jgi:hypothetical protein
VVRRVGTKSGQARVKNQEDEKKRSRERQELTGRTLVSLTNKTNWQQSNRKQV